MNLLSSIAGGAFTVIVFLFCFFAVTFVRLACIGFFSISNFRKSDKTRDESREDENKNESESKPSEPVYYIVERKKKRLDKNYSEPKKISFR